MISVQSKISREHGPDLVVRQCSNLGVHLLSVLIQDFLLHGWSSID